MWPHVLKTRETGDDRDRLVIASHHPDRLQRPAVSPGAAADERFQQSLAWNIFRTLELIAPSYWLRRFHLRLTGEPALVPAQIARVHLWRALPLPPIQRIDGASPPVVADVVIETEHTVWTLVVDSPRRDLRDAATAGSVVDAAVWFAGARQHYCGVIETRVGNRATGSLLRARYSRSIESARLQSASRGPVTPRRSQWGATDWPALAALLHDCAEASNLAPVERALARNATEWLERVGVNPTAERSLTHELSR